MKNAVFRAFRLAVLASLCLLAACGRSGGPAPVELRGLAGSSVPPRAPGAVASAPLGQAAARGGAGGHVVAAGETLYGVARQYSLPVRAVIDANGLQPPYQLLIGQHLAIPQQRTHLVSTGDTLYSISRRYGVDMSEVVRLNNIAPPYAVKLGETLLLPSAVMTAAAAPAAPASVTAAPLAAAPSAAAAAAAAPLSSGVSVAVTPLAPIASAPLAAPLPSPPPLAAPVPGPPALASAIPVPAEGRPPTRPVLSTRRDAAAEPPASEALPPQESPVASAAIPPAAALAAPDQAASPAASPPVAAAPAPEGAEPATPLPEPPAIGAAQQQAVLAPPAPPPRAARSFLWPVRGRVLATYGERAGGLHNDGINIAAAKGSPVHAAENGVVAYAGNEIRGFGNLLLIKHADGFMTAYAHNDALLVQRGDVVRRGQVVARVGSTGNVGQPQLHFEVRKGTQAIDPESVLGNPAAASAL